MTELLFGTAGVPHSARPQTTVDGIKRIAQLGLGCMEIEFVQGIYLNEEEAHQVGVEAIEEEDRDEQGIARDVDIDQTIEGHSESPRAAVGSPPRGDRIEATNCL